MRLAQNQQGGAARLSVRVVPRLILAVTISLVVSLPALALDPGLYPLGDLPGRGFYSHGHGLSADGSVAVGVSESASGPEAFRWTAGTGMVGLGDLPGGAFNSDAFDVSADGSVVVGVATVATATHAFRWTADDGMVDLGDLPGGPQSSYARAISADGTVVVGQAGSSSGPEAMRWARVTGMVGLGDLPGGGFNSDAFRRWQGYRGPQQFNGRDPRLSLDGRDGHDRSGGSSRRIFFSEARGASADGSIITGFGRSASGQEAFRWTAEEGMVGLGSISNSGFFSAAVDISADGSLIVGDSGGVFVWDAAHGMRHLETMLGLDLSDWQFLTPQSISDDGSTIIGFGIRPNGDNEAWIAVLPEPSTLALFSLCALLATRRHRES